MLDLVTGVCQLSICQIMPKQPMHSSTGRFVITYNGEIYNFKDIRTELQNLGIHFRSNSDTEVIVNAVEKWGIEAISRFNGMFAFAVWDKTERCLTLGRDRYGNKTTLRV